MIRKIKIGRIGQKNVVTWKEWRGSEEIKSTGRAMEGETTGRENTKEGTAPRTGLWAQGTWGAEQVRERGRNTATRKVRSENFIER
jgi:hypothetical protein